MIPATKQQKRLLRYAGSALLGYPTVKSKGNTELRWRFTLAFYPSPHGILAFFFILFSFELYALWCLKTEPVLTLD